MNRKKIAKIKQGPNLISLGGPLADSKATLCIYAEDIDLAGISSLLGIEPTEGVRQGEVIGRRRPSPTGHWFLQAPKDLPFEEKLQYLLRVTTDNKSTWNSLILNHRIDLRCVVSLHNMSEGFDLPSDIVAEIGNRHWTFGLAIYSAESDEILDAILGDQVRQKMH